MHDLFNNKKIENKHAYIMTSIILLGLKRLDELGSWRAIRFSEQFMSFDKEQKQRGAIFLYNN